MKLGCTFVIFSSLAATLQASAVPTGLKARDIQVNVFGESVTTTMKPTPGRPTHGMPVSWNDDGAGHSGNRTPQPTPSLPPVDFGEKHGLNNAKREPEPTPDPMLPRYREYPTNATA